MSNPLLSLIATGVSIAGVVVGVMTYFANERVDDLLLKHKAELIEATQPLKDKIDDLDFRLSSIERRIPGSNVHYLDVSKVTVGPETIQGLPSRYTSFDDGEFFVNVPQSSNWTYQHTNELDFLMSTYSFMKQALVGDPRFKQVSEAPLHLWQEKSVVNIISSNTIMGQKVDFAFHPALTMQHFDWQMLKARVATFSKIFHSDSVQKDGTKTANVVGKKIDEIRREYGRINEQVKSVDNVDRSTLTNPVLKKSKLDDETLATLSQVANTSLSTFLFLDLMMQDQSQMNSLGVSHVIVSAQVKGNVFYVEDQMTFRDVEVSVNNEPPAFRKKVTVDEEIFFLWTQGRWLPVEGILTSRS